MTMQTGSDKFVPCITKKRKTQSRNDQMFCDWVFFFSVYCCNEVWGEIRDIPSQSFPMTGDAD